MASCACFEQDAGHLADQSRKADELSARTASFARPSQTEDTSLSMAIQRSKASSSLLLAGMEGLLAAVQASSSNEGSMLDVPAAMPQAGPQAAPAHAMQGNGTFRMIRLSFLVSCRIEQRQYAQHEFCYT